MVYTIVVHLYAKADKEAISKLKAKLVEASQVYSKDKETLSWFVMQDVSDERKFTIVERYLKESVCIFLISVRIWLESYLCVPALRLCCNCCHVLSMSSHHAFFFSELFEISHCLGWSRDLYSSFCR